MNAKNRKDASRQKLESRTSKTSAQTRQFFWGRELVFFICHTYILVILNRLLSQLIQSCINLYLIGSQSIIIT